MIDLKRPREVYGIFFGMPGKTSKSRNEWSLEEILAEEGDADVPVVTLAL